MQTVPRQNITDLYRRFLRFTTAVKHSTLQSYAHRYRLTYGFPPVLADILPISKLNILPQSFAFPRSSPGMGPNSPSLPFLPPQPSSRRSQRPQDHKFFHNWSSLKTILANSLSRSVPIIFRHTMINPSHPVYAHSLQLHGSQGNCAKPLTVAYLYQLGLRTLYFLERAAGLRPYVAYVEYRKPPSSNALPQSSHHQSTSDFQTNFSSRSHHRSRSLPSSTHSISPHHPSSSIIQPTSNISSPNLINQRSTPTHSDSSARLKAYQARCCKNVIFHPYRHFLQPHHRQPFPPQSTSPLISPQRSTKITRSPHHTYNLIVENRARPVAHIIPLSTHPHSLQLLPQDTQLVVFKIHQYFKQIEQHCGGIPLTDPQKAEILSQLSPELQDLLCNQFIINNNHRLEERLLQFIVKGGYFNVGIHSTVPIVIQRHQLVNLLKELQLLIL